MDFKNANKNALFLSRFCVKTDGCFSRKDIFLVQKYSDLSSFLVFPEKVICSKFNSCVFDERHLHYHTKLPET